VFVRREVPLIADGDTHRMAGMKGRFPVEEEVPPSLIVPGAS